MLKNTLQVNDATVEEMIVILNFIIEIVNYIAEQKAHIIAYWLHCKMKWTPMKTHSEQYW